MCWQYFIYLVVVLVACSTQQQNTVVETVSPALGREPDCATCPSQSDLSGNLRVGVADRDRECGVIISFQAGKCEGGQRAMKGEAELGGRGETVAAAAETTATFGVPLLWNDHQKRHGGENECWYTVIKLILQRGSRARHPLLGLPNLVVVKTLSQ
jgi:hypothetical protein